MAKNDEKDVLLDHDYDGIKELDNKLPPWWLYLFYISVIFAFVYMIHYHVIGTGDTSHSEYMKEINPEWHGTEKSILSSLFYHSPLYGTEDQTPRSRTEAELLAAAAEKSAIKKLDITGSDIGFEELILAAMDVSTPSDLEKLQTAFPDIWQKHLTRTGEAAGQSEAAAKPVVEYQALTDQASLAAGKNVFITNCATCHGQFGEGGIGPNMTDDYYLHGEGITNTVNLIHNGVPAKGMISWRGILKEEQILQVASYILTLPGTNPPNAKAPQGEKTAANK